MGVHVVRARNIERILGEIGMDPAVAGKTGLMTDHLVAMVLIAVLLAAFAAVGGELLDLMASVGG